MNMHLSRTYILYFPSSRFVLHLKLLHLVLLLVDSIIAVDVPSSYFRMQGSPLHYTKLAGRRLEEVCLMSRLSSIYKCYSLL